MAPKGKASLPQAGNLVWVQSPLGARGVVGWGPCPGDPQATAGPEVHGNPLQFRGCQQQGGLGGIDPQAQQPGGGWGLTTPRYC